MAPNTLPGRWDYRQALAELWRRSSYERGLISDPFGDIARAEQGLRRTRALLAELNDPHLRVPSVHIAGSKGKGSTGAFIASVGAAAGLRVGFTSSPHLHRFPERIAVDGRPLSDAEFAAAAQSVASAAARLEERAPGETPVSTFEIVTAMAFATFANRACDLAVIEVGLGGRYDATNVLQPIVSVITRIDLEHTAVLGSTYAEIAAQKAGILRAGVPCVTSPQIAAAESAIVRAASQIGAPLLIGGRDWTWRGSWRLFDAMGPWGDWRDLTLGIVGSHQMENACTALAALHAINESGTAIPESAVRSGLANAHWPGRFERVSDGSRTFVFDGAHSPAAARAVVSTWREAGLPASATVILGMGNDKNVGAFLEGLQPIIGRLVATRVDSPRAVEPETIAEIAGKLGIPAETQPSVADAVASVRNAESASILITGSLFVAGEGREALGLAAPDREWRALNDAHRLSRVDLKRP